MGCGASSEPKPTETAKVEVVPEDTEKKEKFNKPPAIQPRMNKAAELAAAKKREEKEEEEKAKQNQRPLGTIMKAPPPTVKGTKSTEKKAESVEQNSIKPAPKPAAKRSGSESTAPSTPLTVSSSATMSAPKTPDKARLDSSTSNAFESSPSDSLVNLNDSDFEDFRTVRMLGKGAFGSTYECALKKVGKVCCVKIIEFGDLADSSTEMANLRNEIALMKRFRHPNIVQYYGCTEDKKSKQINIFMEYVTGGTLNHYMAKFEKVSPETARDWSRQICLGVKYLHDQGIVHRDIKGANILMTNNGEVKLADFGCSKSIDEACSKTRGCQTMVGTPYWMAPEVLKCEPYGTKSDVWSIGCTIVEMITGKPPWPESDNMWGTVYKIANSKGLPPLVPKDLPKDMMNFLEKCFQREPSKRASCDELLKMPWLQF